MPGCSNRNGRSISLIDGLFGWLVSFDAWLVAVDCVECGASWCAASDRRESSRRMFNCECSIRETLCGRMLFDCSLLENRYCTRKRKNVCQGLESPHVNKVNRGHGLLHSFTFKTTKKHHFFLLSFLWFYIVSFHQAANNRWIDISLYVCVLSKVEDSVRTGLGRERGRGWEVASLYI